MEKLTIKEVLQLPPAQKLFWGCMIVISVLATVIVVLWNTNGTLQSDRLTLKDALIQKESDCGKELLMQAQKFNDEKSIIMQNALDFAQQKFAPKEKDIDAAIEEANRVIETQNRTKHQLKKISSAVSKIVEK